MSFLLLLISRVAMHGCWFRLTPGGKIFGGPGGGGGSPGAPPFRPSPRDECRLAAGRMASDGAADLLLADLPSISFAGDRRSLQRRHLGSGDSPDQPERLQNPNQHNHEHDNVE